MRSFYKAKNLKIISTYTAVDTLKSLQWHHNERGGVSNHRGFDCLLNHLIKRRSKKTSKLRVTGLCEGIHRWPVKSPHKGPLTRKNVSIWWRHHDPLLSSMLARIMYIHVKHATYSLQCSSNSVSFHWIPTYEFNFGTQGLCKLQFIQQIYYNMPAITKFPQGEDRKYDAWIWPFLLCEYIEGSCAFCRLLQIHTTTTKPW